MSSMKAYEEVIEFIAAGTSPDDIASFQPSATAKTRVANLIYKEKVAELLPDEKSELDHYMQLEHIMRLAKARARQHISREENLTDQQIKNMSREEKLCAIARLIYADDTQEEMLDKFFEVALQHISLKQII